MRVFVTGASGFVGGHVVEKLAAAHEVLGMARSDEAVRAVEGFGGRAVRSSLGAVTPEDLAGVDAIVHCAARAEDWGTRAQFWSANVEGTRQLVEVARAAGVARFIHIGTEAALFVGQDLVDVDETCPYPERHRFLYPETKAEAERIVLAAADRNFTAMSLRPRFVWGPRDRSVLPSLLDTARRGAFAWIDGGRAQTSTTHVHNLVHAVELALTKGRGGQAYFLADAERSTIREFMTRLVATAGASLGDREISGGLARAAAAVVETTWRLFAPGRRPPLTRFAAAMLSRSVTVVTDKARTELGYTPVILVEAGLATINATSSR